VKHVIDESVRGRAAAPLERYVAWYSGYRQQGVPAGRHRGLPSPYLTLIFTLDDPLVVAGHPDPRQPPGTFLTLLGGLHTTPALITHDGRQSGVQVALNPLGARALCGLPAGELANLDVQADAVLGGAALETQQRMQAAPTWPERFAVLDRLLLRRLAGTDHRPAPELGRAWDLLLRSGGAISVSALAEDVGWSQRRLCGRFSTELGLSPKAAARVVRFDRARRLCGAGQGSLADLAARAGYFDQAHLAREFRAFAGCSPSQWLAEHLSETYKPPPLPPDDPGTDIRLHEGGLTS
jgi:AraC-like DNA-binding protein